MSSPCSLPTDALRSPARSPARAGINGAVVTGAVRGRRGDHTETPCFVQSRSCAGGEKIYLQREIIKKKKLENPAFLTRQDAFAGAGLRAPYSSSAASWCSCSTEVSPLCPLHLDLLNSSSSTSLPLTAISLQQLHSALVIPSNPFQLKWAGSAEAAR